MAETFDCPKCGAPQQYNAGEQGEQETISCPYCGETVIIPAELRRSKLPEGFDLSGLTQTVIDFSETSHPAVISVNTGYTPPVQVGKTSKRTLGSCVIVAAITIGIIGIGVFLAINSLTKAALQAADSLQNQPALSIPTQAAALIVEASRAAKQPTPQASSTETPQPTDTPTPEDNPAATAEAEATRAAQNDLIAQQRGWPVVVQEKFTNDKLNWVTGLDNNDLAIEDVRIAGSKYTWKFSTKKSMGSFSFPDMPVQTDSLVSVDVQMTTASGNSADQAGIIFRHSGQDKSFYFFGVNPDGTYSLTLYDGSDWNDLIPLTETDLVKAKQVNHLAVSVQDNQILLVINNAVVNSFEDAQLSSGDAGLGLNLPSPGEDVTVIFTNFSVRAPKK